MKALKIMRVSSTILSILAVDTIADKVTWVDFTPNESVVTEATAQQAGSPEFIQTRVNDLAKNFGIEGEKGFIHTDTLLSGLKGANHMKVDDTWYVVHDEKGDGIFDYCTPSPRLAEVINDGLFLLSAGKPCAANDAFKKMFSWVNEEVLAGERELTKTKYLTPLRVKPA